MGAPGAARSIALEGGEVVGYVAVVRLNDWSNHVGEVRLVVDPAQRGRGVGRRSPRGRCSRRSGWDLAKVVVEVIADQEALIAMFRALGFEPEALLTDHVRDRPGEVRDLMVLANSVDGQFASMAAAGISTASDATELN